MSERDCVCAGWRAWRARVQNPNLAVARPRLCYQSEDGRNRKVGYDGFDDTWQVENNVEVVRPWAR